MPADLQAGSAGSARRDGAALSPNRPDFGRRCVSATMLCSADLADRPVAEAGVCILLAPSLSAGVQVLYIVADYGAS